MRLTFRQFAAEGDPFAPDAFDGFVGNTVPAEWAGTAREAVLTEARVADDGCSVELTIDIE